MRRRTFLAGAAALCVVSPAARAAQSAGPVRRIGRLSPISAAAEPPVIAGLRQGLRDLGWIEGENIAFEFRFADGRFDRLPQLAEELVRLKVDVIVAGSNPGAMAAKNATRDIPIVVVTTGDPIGGGLVASLARPGGNLTGVTALGQELTAKRLELLKEAMPGITQVAVLTNPGSPTSGPLLKEGEEAARSLGLRLTVLKASDAGEIDSAFAAMANARAEALMVPADIMFNSQTGNIAELAARHRLPATYGEREFVSAGGLMFYGASLPDMYRHAATHIDKIFKGAKPADLPIEQPTKFDLVINLKAARTLGIAIPPSLLLRADEVIE
jgi:putative ABC transport system substrate-binding protein